MSAKARLQTIEAALRERGVVDVKFLFTNNGASLSALADNVADALEAVLQGHATPSAALGDYNAA